MDQLSNPLAKRTPTYEECYLLDTMAYLGGREGYVSDWIRAIAESLYEETHTMECPNTGKRPNEWLNSKGAELLEGARL